MLIDLFIALSVLLAALLFGWWLLRRRHHWQPPSGQQLEAVLHLRRLGERGSPVLLLHGLAASGRYYGAAFDALADEHRLIVPDLLGFGRSPRPPGGSYGVGEHLGALTAMLDELGIDEPACVVGHSTGCVLALALADAHPERVAAVVAFAPPVYDSEARARQKLSRMSAMVRMLALDTSLAAATCKFMCDHREGFAFIAPLLRPDLPVPIARDGVRHNWHSYSQTLERVILGSASARWLETTAAPVTLVAGDRDAIIDTKLLERVAAERDKVRFHQWRGRHDLPLSHPAACVALVRRAAAGERRSDEPTGGGAS